ncbi:MAG: sel1 repeat family protein [Alphaproteobacteria bacterium]|nr:sel1 repeat family protein [Alphaproteobacteria bacterium]
MRFGWWVVVALGIGLGVVPARAQEPPPQDCDRLAAAPADGFGRGVEFNEMDAAKATQACHDAVKAHPQSLRLKAHLARALVKAGDFKQARALLEDAAAKGHAGAQGTLGSLYYSGVGVDRDFGRARALFEEAIKRDNAVALNNLGVMYTFGHGVGKDEAKAVPLFEKAAAAGHPDALTNLGNMYEQGSGVERDVRKAATLYEQAAQFGNAKGQLNLAQIYEAGGALAGGSIERAYFWYTLAARRGAGDVAAVALKGQRRIETFLKPDDIVGLGHEVAAWKPKG